MEKERDLRMKPCKSCGRPVLENGVCICRHKSVGTWGPWKATTKPLKPLTERQLKLHIRELKCQAAVGAARQRIHNDEEFLQGGSYEEEECDD